jgi:hypothetical protein
MGIPPRVFTTKPVFFIEKETSIGADFYQPAADAPRWRCSAIGVLAAAFLTKAFR